VDPLVLYVHLNHTRVAVLTSTQNVGPHPRRPGFFPPGVPGTSGDYGLPAASRYGPAGPSRPTAGPGPDTGLGNTTDESTTPTTITEELVTPFITDHKTLEPHIHTPSGETVINSLLE
jgi:hypothetical protein